ncbi:hypothetical protein RJT34_12823 [Clitoria ternatea]|uniref:HTH myb-type domain-containing protein n=1 Tax=Clitoria ternatea TaxID=43366 RepID=A0AAN9JPJ8_CLITE
MGLRALERDTSNRILWSLLAESLTGRMDNAIKNYWHNQIKKFLKRNSNNTTCDDDDSDELKSKAIELRNLKGQ